MAIRSENEEIQTNKKGKKQEKNRKKNPERPNSLLHMCKDLSTSRLFYKSVPDDKHSNNQYL